MQYLLDIFTESSGRKAKAQRVCVYVHVFVYMSIVCMYICETLAKGLILIN